MTNILVDIGNSALKWSSLENMEKPRAYLHDSKTQLSSVLVSDLSRLPFEEAWACSVAQQPLAAQFEELVNCKGGKVHWLRAEEKFEGPLTMINEYDSPSRLGADRWFAALGAASQYFGNSIVLVQFGTKFRKRSLRISWRKDCPGNRCHVQVPAGKNSCVERELRRIGGFS